MTTKSTTNPADTEDGAVLRLQRIKRETVAIEIVGVTPLIPHKWSEKALRMMREAQSGPKTRTKREAKDPLEEANGTLYLLSDGRPGMPATAFKAAIIGAARLYDGVTMTGLKSALFVEGEGPDQLVPIVGEKEMREDTPRNANGVADLRYRWMFYPWSATLFVTYAAAVLDRSSVVSLVDAAGYGGVGDWRPSAPKSHTGTFGRFETKKED